MGNRIYVGNLSFHTTAESVHATFAEFGEIVDVHLVLDRATGRSRGFAFVTLATASAASKAIEAMDGTPLDGRALRVREALERPGSYRPSAVARTGGTSP
jgi:RNA recognition motif-containing protein